jgi:hypothetical protein
MAELKTKKTNASVKAFLNTVPGETKRADSFKLLEIFEEVTGEKATMWGPAIVGFGEYHYKSERSTQEGDWPRTGFSPRKQSLTLYVTLGDDKAQALLSKLGKHTTSKACLYINKLSDVDEKVLRKIVQHTLVEMEKQYPS